MLMPFLSIAALIAMGLNLSAEYFVMPWLKYLSKPLVMLFIMMLAYQIPAPLSGYKVFIVVALLFSTAGDVFLMLPQDLFLGGLISFLIAHLFFSKAMSEHLSLDMGSIVWILPFFLYAVLLFYLLLPKLKKSLKIPVIAYVLVIMSMGFLTVLHRNQEPGLFTNLSLIAALLFIMSDTCLAFNRFHTPFKAARYITLSTYFISQWLFALSIYGVLV